jgi:hypothetical protein
MKNLFRAWLSHEAAWWQFWWPQSGTAGGFLMGCVLGGVLAFLGVRV